MKIISLVPSITETLFDFGLTKHEIIGRTKFCIHPKEHIQNIEIIGGTKNINIEKIKALQPDLIIANKEENEKIQIEELQKTCRVWVTNITSIADNAQFLWEMGMVLKKPALANQFVAEIDSIFSSVKSGATNKKVAYIIWQNPLMTVGGDTFISAVLEETGFKNIFDATTRYPVIEIENLADAAYVFLSSEPYPFKEKHILEYKKTLPHSKIILVDGEAFSWFGTHLLQCRDYLQNLISL